MWTWGYGIDGQLGHNDTEEYHKPKEVVSIRGAGITHAFCGTDFTCLLNSKTGELYTFGNGETGQLGHGQKVCSYIGN